jgi:hypothetical protein
LVSSNHTMKPHARSGRAMGLFASLGLLGVCIQAATVQAQQLDAALPRAPNGYWSTGKPRLFVSARNELGAPYAKPYFSAGYGMPHWIWTGVDVNAIMTMEFVQAYAGVRASSPILDFAFGVRDTASFGKHMLVPADRYTKLDLLDGPGPIAHYWAWEAEAVAIAPLPHAAVVADFVIVRTLDVPKGREIYEESYRAIVKNPLFYVLRAAAVARFLNEDCLKVGVLSEFVFGTGRDKPVVRVGPAGSLQVTDHLEVNAVLTLAVSSPDDLGLSLGAYGVAGVRYRWATGESDPKWPWQGQIIP